MDFPYGEAEIAHLRTRDPKLGAAIDRIGPIHLEVDPDLFSSVLHHIIGQQVSMAAQRTVWQRLQTAAAPPLTGDGGRHVGGVPPGFGHDLPEGIVHFGIRPEGGVRRF